MRLHFKLKTNKTIVPFDHFPKVIGAVHKWIGKNDIHDSISLYSLSTLKGAKQVDTGLLFENGASFFFSSINNELLKRIIDGVNISPEIAYGMTVGEIIIQEDPDFTNQDRFIPASPIFIKRTLEKGERHFTIDDDEADLYLTETMQNKLKTAGYINNEATIKFDRSYPTPKIKLVSYKGIKNKTTLCPIIIQASPEVKAFIWNVGVGNSTGIGFGSLI
ncbi:MAG: CRISPR-associated endoribonuclease Cas6 [Bacteroidetes bacterium]|nr:CRISPR-associated endoribonuclease Cas6 [Bacteroidota bacterium]